MKPPAQNRTTSTPGVVDLPRPRRTTAEVTLEKKKKSDMAATKAETKRQVGVRLAELERQMAMMQNEGSGINALSHMGMT